MDTIIFGLLSGLLFVIVGSFMYKTNDKMQLALLKRKINNSEDKKEALCKLIYFCATKESFRKEAIPYIKLAEENYQSDKKININICIYHTLVHDLDAALIKIDELYKLYSDDPDIVFGKALTHLRRDEVELANEYRKKAIALDKKYAKMDFSKDI